MNDIKQFLSHPRTGYNAKKAGRGRPSIDGKPRPALLGLFSGIFPRVWKVTAPAIERHCRSPCRRPQAAKQAKTAPFLYSFSLAVINRADADDYPERLLALAAALPAKAVVLPPSVLANEKAPFQTRLFR